MAKQQQQRPDTLGDPLKEPGFVGAQEIVPSSLGPQEFVKTVLKTPEASSGKSAVEAVKYLRETGTPDHTLERFADWMKERPSATGDELYGAMVEASITLGTIRKLGKFLYGENFEPEEVAKQAPVERMKQLESEVAILRRQVQSLTAEKGLMLREMDRAREDRAAAMLTVAQMRAAHERPVPVPQPASA